MGRIGPHICVTRGAEQKLKCLREEEAHERMAVNLEDYNRTLNMVTPFKYLGRSLTASKNDCLKVVVNIRKSRSRWARLVPCVASTETGIYTDNYPGIRALQRPGEK